MIKIEIDEDSGIWEPTSYEEVDNMEYAHRLYREHVVRIGKIYAGAMGEIEPTDEVECEIDTLGSNIEISWTEYGQCGGWEGRSITFLQKYLWEEDWEEELRQERIKKQIEAVYKKEEEKKANALKKEARDYETYLKLKEKFKEGTPNG